MNQVNGFWKYEILAYFQELTVITKRLGQKENKGGKPLSKHEEEEEETFIFNQTIHLN